MFFLNAKKKQPIFTLLFILVLVLTSLLSGCSAKKSEPTTSTAPIAATSPEAAQTNQTPDEYWADVVEKGKAEGVVNAGTSLGAVDFIPFAIEAMQRLYGIKLEHESLNDARNIAKMKAELAANNYQKDLVSLNLSIIKGNLNLLDEFGYIPELENGKFAVDMKANSPGLLLGAQSFGFGINTKLIPPGTEPKSIKELADPKYKGLIVLSAPIGPGGITEWATRVLELYGEDWMKRFYANCIILPVEAAPTIRQKIASGEYGINPADGWATLPFIKQNKGLPYTFTIPEEGTFSRQSTVALVKNAPHPNAARLLVNWILSPEGQQAVAKAAQTPLRIDTQPLPYPLVQDLDKMKFLQPFPDTIEFYNKVQGTADFSKKIFEELNIKVQG